MTLLWVLSSHDGLELAEDGAADVPFEVSADEYDSLIGAH